MSKIIGHHWHDLTTNVLYWVDEVAKNKDYQ